MKMVKAALLAGAMAFVGSAASAAILNYDGQNSGNATVSYAAPTGSASAGAFSMRDTTNALGLGTSFLAWCLDLSTTIKNSADYVINNVNPFSGGGVTLSGAQVGNIQKLFDANYDTLDLSASNTNRNRDSAAFQVALWEVTYETGTVGDAGAGGYSTTNGSVNAQANAYLSSALSYALGKKYDLDFLQATGSGGYDSQNLVTASPIPLPAAGLLLFGALGALGAASRRRNATTA